MGNSRKEIWEDRLTIPRSLGWILSSILQGGAEIKCALWNSESMECYSSKEVVALVQGRDGKDLN